MIIQHVVYGAEQGSLGAPQQKNIFVHQRVKPLWFYKKIFSQFVCVFFMYIYIG